MHCSARNLRGITATVATLMLAACAGDSTPGSDTLSATIPEGTPPIATAPTDSVTAPTPSGVATLAANGGGGVTVGMTQEQTRAALGLAQSDPRQPSTGCAYIPGVGAIRGAFIMLVNDSVARVDVRDSAIATVEGAKVGDTEARINELYGARVKTSPHKYTGPTGHYMTVTPDDGRLRIVFETDGQRVVNWRVGRTPEVEWVEGCS